VAVIDTGGRLIGIHAAAEIQFQSIRKLARNVNSNSVYSLGIPIRTFGASAAGKGMGLN